MDVVCAGFQYRVDEFAHGVSSQRTGVDGSALSGRIDCHEQLYNPRAVADGLVPLQGYSAIDDRIGYGIT